MGLSWDMSSSLLHSLRSAHKDTLATTNSLASSGQGTLRQCTRTMSGFCHFPRKERGEKEVFQLRVSHSFSLVANDMPHRLGRPSPRLFTAHKGLWMRIYSSFTHSQEGPPSLFNVTKSLSTGTRAVGLLLSKGFQMGVDILKPVSGGSRSFFFSPRIPTTTTWFQFFHI